MYGRVIGLPVRMRAPDHPGEIRRRVDPLQPDRQRALPARPDDCEVSRPVSRRARPRRGEDVRPGVEHRHQVVAAVRVRQAQHDRLRAKVEDDAGIQRVRVRADNVGEGRVRELAPVRELVRRRVLPRRPRHRRDRAGRHLHQHQGTAERSVPGFDPVTAWLRLAGVGAAACVATRRSSVAACQPERRRAASRSEARNLLRRCVWRRILAWGSRSSTACAAR